MRKLYHISVFALLGLFFCGMVPMHNHYVPKPGGINADSVVKAVNNYMNYMNGIASHGERFMKTYARVAGHNKYREVLDADHWPDSVTETVNIIYYQGEPVEYIETPAVDNPNENLEYDNYFYHKKLIAYRGLCILNGNRCGTAFVTRTQFVYYDTTGIAAKTVNKTTDANNQPIDTLACPLKYPFTNHSYTGFFQTPLARLGTEKVLKKPGGWR